MNPFGSESDRARGIILNHLSRGLWYAPHEIYQQVRLQGCDLSADSSEARKRDLRKARYGGHKLVKRRRAGTDYFEYRIEVRNDARNEAA